MNKQLSFFWAESKKILGWNDSMNYFSTNCMVSNSYVWDETEWRIIEIKNLSERSGAHSLPKVHKMNMSWRCHICLSILSHVLSPELLSMLDDIWQKIMSANSFWLISIIYNPFFIWSPCRTSLSFSKVAHYTKICTLHELHISVEHFIWNIFNVGHI